MQPRQRSKCSTTVAVERDRAVEPRLHQLDAAARGVHLLAPEQIRRAGRQAEAAVDAVAREPAQDVDVGDAHASSPRRVELRADPLVQGLHGCGRLVSAPRAARRRCRRPGARPPRSSPASVVAEVAGSEAHACRARRPAVRGPRPRRRRRSRSPPTSARAASSCSSHRRRRSPRRGPRHGPGGARRARSAASCERSSARDRGRRVVRLGDERAGAGGNRVEAQADTRAISASRPARAADELAEVVAGDVLDDLAAGVRDGAVGEHERDAEHEIAWGAPKRWRSGPERFFARQAPIVGSPGGSSDSRCPWRPSAAFKRRQPDARLDRARQVARLVLEDAVEARRVEIVTDPHPPCPRHAAPRRSAAASLEAGHARNARQRPILSRGCMRYGPGTSPQRRGVGTTLPGIREAVRVEGAAQAPERLEIELREHLRHRARLVDADAVLSGERAAGVETRRQDRLRELLGAPPPRPWPRRRGRAGAGCRRLRGTRCRRGGRARSESSPMRRRTSGSLVRGTTPSWT